MLYFAFVFILFLMKWNYKSMTYGQLVCVQKIEKGKIWSCSVLVPIRLRFKQSWRKSRDLRMKNIKHSSATFISNKISWSLQYDFRIRYYQSKNLYFVCSFTLKQDFLNELNPRFTLCPYLLWHLKLELIFLLRIRSTEKKTETFCGRNWKFEHSHLFYSVVWQKFLHRRYQLTFQ